MIYLLSNHPPQIAAEHYLFKLIDSNFMLESLQALDRTVFLALNGMHTPYLDSFMYIFTSKLVWIPLYASYPATSCIKT